MPFIKIHKSFEIAIMVVIAAVAVTGPLCKAQAALAMSSTKVTLVTNDKQQFNGLLRNARPANVKWLVAGIPGGNPKVGTISSAGLYVAPKLPTTSDVYVSAVDNSNSRVVAAVSVTVVESQAVTEAHERWLAGVAEVAAQHGCNPELIQQLPTETVDEALKLYAQVAKDHSCLVLLPVSNSPETLRYSFSSGGEVDGVNVLYISDVNRMRIWNGAEVESD